MKGNACRRVGMDSLQVEMPAGTTTGELLARIAELNHNPNVHGILLQHPVPAQIDERACFDAIALGKDVDGVTCLGFGRMNRFEDTAKVRFFCPVSRPPFCPFPVTFSILPSPF